MPPDRTNDHYTDAQPASVVASSQPLEVKRAFAKLQQVIEEGLRHGFFECTVACEVTAGKKRRLIIKAGVSYQFIIPLEEIASLT